MENSDFTPSQVGCLFTFLARQLAKPNNTLFVNRTLFDQVKWASTNWGVGSMAVQVLFLKCLKS